MDVPGGCNGGIEKPLAALTKSPARHNMAAEGA
jgi:hypothetical protein